MARDYDGWYEAEEAMLSRLDGDIQDDELAWDFDPFYSPLYEDENYDCDLDDEDAHGDWQVLANDRFGDRLINSNY